MLRVARQYLSDQGAKAAFNPIHLKHDPQLLLELLLFHAEGLERVMSQIESMVPATEIYSIGECFAYLSGIQENLTQFGRKLRSRIIQCTGIPVGGGIAGTKNLAKLANHTAKRLQAQTGGVVDITDPFKRDWVLRNTEVKAVWGVARRMTAHLEAMGIHTAMDLAKADARALRRQFSVVIEKTARELA